MLLNGGHRNMRTRYAPKSPPYGADNLWNTRLTGHLGGKYEPLTKSTGPKVVWLWLERSFSWLTTSCFSSCFLSHPWFLPLFVPIYLLLLVYFFISATCFSFWVFFLFPDHYILGFFSFFSNFFPHFNFCSGFGCIIHFMMVLLFPQCICPNISSSLFDAASLLSPGVPKGLKFHRRLLLEGSGGETGGQAKWVTWEVGHSSKAFYMHKTWKGEEGEG